MKKSLISLSVLLSVISSDSVLAKKKVEYSGKPFIGYRQDQFKWNTKTGASQKWKNLRGIEYGVKNQIIFLGKYTIDVDFGFANLFNGSMTDNRYLAAPGGVNPTRNSSKGTAFIFEPNIAFGFKAKPLKCLELMPMVGMSYDLVKISENKKSGNPLTSISNTLNFYGPYVGANALIKLGKKVVIDTGLAYKIAFYNGKGNWKFANNTTTNTMTQSGNGHGVKAKFGVHVQAAKSVMIGLESAFEWNRISSASDTRKFSNGATSKTKSNVKWTTISGRLVVTKSF